jgi:hypothetical protein
MSSTFARPLNDNRLAHLFLVKTLGFPNDIATGKTSIRIRAAESMLAEMEGKSSLKSVENRHQGYADEGARIGLRQRIFEELLQKKQLVSDEKITFGKGGAKPRSPIQKAKNAFIVTGLPASGKSSISSVISDKHGAYMIDPDFAKRKFPEYDFDFGASLVHEESSLVVNGSVDPKYADEPNLLEFLVSQGVNIVIPKIGYDLNSLRLLRADLISAGYDVHLTVVSLDRVSATKRALKRYTETNRYVPLSVVFDGYGNDPILTYYRTKLDPEWASTGKISTDVARGTSPIVIECGENNPAALFI